MVPKSSEADPDCRGKAVGSVVFGFVAHPDRLARKERAKLGIGIKGIPDPLAKLYLCRKTSKGAARAVNAFRPATCSKLRVRLS